MAKALLTIFVDFETLGRTVNSLTEAGVTGFYCVEYWGVSPQNWSGFIIKEEPEMAIEAIKDNTERAIQVNTVVESDRAEMITRALEESLEGKRYTIMRVPVDSIHVAAP